MTAQEFTKLDSESIQALEKEIAYFYDVSNPARVAEHYINAIRHFESSKDDEQKEATLPFLRKAYEEVNRQSQLDFDVNQVALYEYDLILAQSAKYPTEKIIEIMVKIYQTIFKSTDASLDTIARLRTFLYQYKIHLIANSQDIIETDKKLMQSIDQRSKELLRHFTQKT